MDDSDTLSHTLKLHGVTVRKATNGLDGLNIALKEEIDLVISDIEMPHMDGLEMTKQLKAVKPNLPIILMVAFHEESYLLRAIDIGVNHFLFKPLQSIQLLNIMSLYHTTTSTRRALAEHKKLLDEYKKLSMRAH